jgi:glycosyltransferase involved in cell wall biosynthesis
MRELVGLRLATTRGFFSEVDQIVVLAEWAREVLLINDVAPEKILLSRHGIEDVGSSHDSQAPQVPPPPPLRLAFLGRIGPAKGPDILVDALRLLPHGQITLGLYGITQDTSAQSSLTDLVRRAQGDVRVRFHPPVPQEEVTPLLRHYHMLAVPSRWLETGPLVILEAFAAGIPVLGMDRGGIAELVQDGVNGLLVRDESPETWRDVILRLIESPDLVCRLRAGIRVPRSVDTVAEEMDALYRSLRSGTPVKR